MSVQGFQSGGASEDLFESAAPFYAKFRRPYPPPVISYLVESFHLDGRGRLLDGGCGTGQVFQVLGRYFDEVIAFDVNQEMVRYAAKAAAESGLEKINVMQMRAEDIDEQLGIFRMAVFGASFHWMNRRRVAEVVYDQLEPGGHLVVISPGGFHSGTAEWEAEIRLVLEEWLGPERRAGKGTYIAGEQHGSAIRATRFGEAQETDIPVVERYSLDEIVGYLFSTSYASRAVLGDGAERFERVIRERLLRLRPEGWFEKVTEYTAICATRPG